MLHTRIRLPRPNESSRARSPCSDSPKRPGVTNLIRQLTHAASTTRRPGSELNRVRHREVDQDLFEHEEFLRQNWPRGHPSGEGQSHFDTVVRAREWRLKWLLRLEVFDRFAAVSWKVTLAIAGALSVVHQLPPW